MVVTLLAEGADRDEEEERRILLNSLALTCPWTFLVVCELARGCLRLYKR